MHVITATLQRDDFMRPPNDICSQPTSIESHQEIDRTNVIQYPLRSNTAPAEPYTIGTLCNPVLIQLGWSRRCETVLKSRPSNSFCVLLKFSHSARVLHRAKPAMQSWTNLPRPFAHSRTCNPLRPQQRNGPWKGKDAVFRWPRR